MWISESAVVLIRARPSERVRIARLCKVDICFHCSSIQDSAWSNSIFECRRSDVIASIWVKLQIRVAAKVADAFSPFSSMLPVLSCSKSSIAPAILRVFAVSTLRVFSHPREAPPLVVHFAGHDSTRVVLPSPVVATETAADFRLRKFKKKICLFYPCG